jgi:clan AA aspartic protease (TIGR02281 family)
MKSHDYESTDVVKIPFQPQGNDLMVQVKINGHPTAMYFDTGAQTISLSYFTAAALGIRIPSDAQPVVSGGVGGRVGGVRVYVDRIELGPLIKTNVPVTLLMGVSPPLLGQPFFSDRKFTIDNDNHTINFAH